MTGAVFDSSLQALLLLGALLTACKLYYLGLHRRYPILFLYFVLRVPHSLWPLLLDRRSTIYFYVWLGTSPLFLALYVLLVFELYRLVLENYKGLQTLGRWAMYIFSAISVTISALSLIPQLKPSDPSRNKLIGMALAAERGVDTSLAIFLILLTLFLSRYPVKVSRNVRLYALVFPVFFLGNTLVLLMRSLFGMKLAAEANTVLEVVCICSVFVWLFMLNRAGEDVPVATRHLNKEHEERLLTQLDAMNSTILGVSRR